MREIFRTTLRIAPVMLLLLFGGAASSRAQSAKLQLDQLDVLANRASNTVDIKLDEHLMQITAKIFSKDPEEAEIKELLKSVKGIYVKNFSFAKENEYQPAEIDSVMSQLRGGGWSKIVGITSKKENENVEVYLMTVADQISGLAVVSLNPKEVTVVNIVGPINLEKLSQLEGSFGIPDLDLAKPKAKKDNDN
ncbi:MAG TPA: DUF4252 domain-containing protein [Pyrinomonadaceae bacterium]|jgi:hypothetical protein|nr:DUF4252 domain-containing protein [Pyrinomonadaceae bacterium]